MTCFDSVIVYSIIVYTTQMLTQHGVRQGMYSPPDMLGACNLRGGTLSCAGLPVIPGCFTIVRTHMNTAKKKSVEDTRGRCNKVVQSLPNCCSYCVCPSHFTIFYTRIFNTPSACAESSFWRGTCPVVAKLRQGQLPFTR